MERQRLAYLDNLRLSLTALVICHHINSAYGAPGGFSFIVSDESGGALTQLLMAMFAGCTQAFFMSSFFLVSAFFTPPGMDTKGAWGYMRRRLLRLGIPICAYYYLLSPTLKFCIHSFRSGVDQGYLEYLFFGVPRVHSFGPLWFAVTLLLFETGYLLCRAAARRRSWGQGPFPLPSNRQVAVFVVVVGLATFLFRCWWPAHRSFMGLRLANFPMYICMFTLGVQARRSCWFEALSRKQASLWFRVALVAIATTPVFLILNELQGNGPYAFMGGFKWQGFVYAMWEPLLCVGINMKLIVLFRDRFNAANALTRSMARSSFAAYIIHVYFVVFGVMLFTHFSLGAIPEILLLCLPVIAACFLCATLIRSMPVLNRIL